MDIEIKISPRVTDEELTQLFDDAWGWKNEGCRDFSAQLQHAMFYACGYVDGALVGFAKVVWDGGEHGFLLDPTVSPEHRKEGFGKKIVSACVMESQRRGISWLHVDFEPHLAPFYRSCGFRSTDAGLINLRELRPNKSSQTTEALADTSTQRSKNNIPAKRPLFQTDLNEINHQPTRKPT